LEKTTTRRDVARDGRERRRVTWTTTSAVTMVHAVLSIRSLTSYCVASTTMYA